MHIAPLEVTGWGPDTNTGPLECTQSPQWRADTTGFHEAHHNSTWMGS